MLIRRRTHTQTHTHALPNICSTRYPVSLCAHHSFRTANKIRSHSGSLACAAGSVRTVLSEQEDQSVFGVETRTKYPYLLDQPTEMRSGILDRFVVTRNSIHV